MRICANGEQSQRQVCNWQNGEQSLRWDCAAGQRRTKSIMILSYCAKDTVLLRQSPWQEGVDTQGILV